MAIRLPRPQRVSRQDLGPKTPDWLDLLLGPLNTFMAQTVQALADLVGAEKTKTLDFTTGASVATSFPMLFANELPQAPVEVRIAQVLPVSAGPATLTSAVGLPVWDMSGGQIRIWSIAGLNTGTRYQVRVLYK